MPLEKKDKVEFIFKTLTLIGASIAFIFTIITWQEQNHIKRAEFLENRIKEFQDSSMYLAKAILDGFAVRWDNTDRKSVVQMVLEGSSRGTNNDIKSDDLITVLLFVLRDTIKCMDEINILKNEPAKIDTLNSRQRVRASFDNLLDFFGKLQYYIDLDLLTPDEAKYFNYYLKKCAGNSAINKYSIMYDFEGYQKLIKTMGLKMVIYFDKTCP